MYIIRLFKLIIIYIKKTIICKIYFLIFLLIFKFNELYQYLNSEKNYFKAKY